VNILDTYLKDVWGLKLCENWSGAYILHLNSLIHVGNMTPRIALLQGQCKDIFSSPNGISIAPFQIHCRSQYGPPQFSITVAVNDGQILTESFLIFHLVAFLTERLLLVMYSMTGWKLSVIVDCWCMLTPTAMSLPSSTQTHRPLTALTRLYLSKYSVSYVCKLKLSFLGRFQ
jgi:hypothetical protein